MPVLISTVERAVATVSHPDAAPVAEGGRQLMGDSYSSATAVSTSRSTRAWSRRRTLGRGGGAGDRSDTPAEGCYTLPFRRAPRWFGRAAARAIPGGGRPLPRRPAMLHVGNSAAALRASSSPRLCGGDLPVRRRGGRACRPAARRQRAGPRRERAADRRRRELSYDASWVAPATPWSRRCAWVRRRRAS